MNMNNENKVYRIGRGRNERLAAWAKVIIAGLLIILAATLIYKYMWDNKPSPSTEKAVPLDAVDILPEGSRPPLFMGKYHVERFLQWISTNVKYPAGLENRNARVVIEFVVQVDGQLGQFKIVSAPTEKAFSDMVVQTLQRSPKWTPARLNDGTVVPVKYTLPITFSKVRTE